jgi:signal transduction histidine kinase
MSGHPDRGPLSLPIVGVARWLGGLVRDLLFLVIGGLLGAWVLLLAVCIAAVASTPTALVVLLPLIASVRLLLPAERLRLRLVGAPVPEPRPTPPVGRLARFVRFVAGPLNGEQLRHLLLLAPVGIGSALLCGAAWTATVLGLVDGHWARVVAFLPGDLTMAADPGWAQRLLSAVILLPLAALTTRQLAMAQVRGAQSRLGDTDRDRIDQVLSSRARAMDAQTAELRRIERDLHDGAQARLVALTMQLGLLGRALRPLGADADQARGRLGSAVETANAALADLRHLVRGIHPPILTDRGLDAALTALSADCALPVDLDLAPGGRLAPAIEAAAYFTVAEALANAAKHASADRCGVSTGRSGGMLRVTVTDDGRGGADPDGPGLTGLLHRVEALDGTLVVTSPAGGPTTVRAELPCG